VAAQPEEYHVVDPSKADFKLVLAMRSMTNDSSGSIIDGDIGAAKIDDEPFPAVQENEYRMELSSKQISGGKIRTTQFGDFLVRSSGTFGIEIMMTDRQQQKVRDFIVAQRRDAGK
jgi:hypothetical protein